MLLPIVAVSSVIIGLCGIVVGNSLVAYHRARGGPRRLMPAHIWGMAISYCLLVWVAVPGVYFSEDIQTFIHLTALVIGVVSLIQLVRHQRIY